VWRNFSANICHFGGSAFVAIFYKAETCFKYTEISLLIHATLKVAPFVEIVYKAEPY